jgi:hypothetical protein
MVWHFRAITTDLTRYWPLLPVWQPGIWGPQVGRGSVSVADWWLRKEWLEVEEEETEAAAAPAITRESAKMRTTSFMMSNLSL